MHGSMAITFPSTPDHFSPPTHSLAPGVFLVHFQGSILAAKVRDLEQVNDAEMENLATGVRVRRLFRHANILPFVTAFLHQSNLWSLSPYCDLRSASELCQPYGLRELVICVIVRDTLKALQYLHERGVVHRAVCGSHVLVKSEGRCLLTGLDYATHVVRHGLWRTSLHDFPQGAKKNLTFLAPEVLEQNLLGYNHKSDIYSLGVMCCELANGVIPYWNLQPAEMLLDKLTGNHAKPIDNTCIQYLNVRGELTPEEHERYERYKSRRFSDHFHVFSVSLCLNSDPHKRPTAQQLLTHGFVKQVKKTSVKDLLFKLKKERTLTEEHKSHTSQSQNRTYDQVDRSVEWTF